MSDDYPLDKTRLPRVHPWMQELDTLAEHAARRWYGETQRLRAEIERLTAKGGDMIGTWMGKALRAEAEVDRLRALLREANEAFDECTGDYPKELVEGEAWRTSAEAHRETLLRLTAARREAQP